MGCPRGIPDLIYKKGNHMYDFTGEEKERFDWTMSEFRKLNKFNQKVFSYRKAYEKSQRRYQRALESFLLNRVMSNENELNFVVREFMGDYLSDITNVQTMRRDIGLLEGIVDDWRAQLSSGLEELGIEVK
jgi:uncharacterized protein with von Willebrand factor type A (vWA) domain